MKKIYLLLVILLATYQTWSQTTSIPDVNFEQKLIDYGYDDEIDGLVITANITGVANLNITSSGILSLEGIKDFVSLQGLSCSGNSLTSLDVSNMPNLVSLAAYSNSITSLNISGLNLNYLEVDGNSIPSIDLSACTNLETLWLSYSPITTLDLSHNINLKYVYLAAMQLAVLDVSALTSLQVLDVSYNQLQNLDLQGLTSLTNMNCGVNALSCITVDNVATAMAQSNWYKDTTASYNTFCTIPGITQIPDVAFENFLINQGYDTVVDGLVATVAISGLTSLDVSSLGITDLTGIQDFAALQYLNCSNNQLTSLDVTMLSNLVELVCNNNQLTGLTVTGLNGLQVLNFSTNTITNIDFVGLGSLISLAFSNNAIHSVDISSLSSLTSLECVNNGLESLDLTGINTLAHLNCSTNILTELDLTGNNLTTFSAEGNALLNCIKVNDVDVALANTNWTIDPASSYNTTCASPLFFVVPDANFEQALIDLTYDDVIDGMVLKSNVSAVPSLDLSSKNITNLTGIKYFTALTTLNCSTNNLVSLPMMNLSALVTLDCSANQILNLSCNGMTSLETLHANGNQLIGVDLNQVTALRYLDLDDNQINNIDISALFSLEELHFANNNAKTITTPQVSFLMNFKKLYCNNNKLESLFISSLPNLEYLDCSHNELSGQTAIIGGGMGQLTYLNMSHNSLQLNSFYFGGFTNLETMICTNNKINQYNWGWSDFPAIKYFDASNNEIELMQALPSSLLTMDCSFNKLTALDFTAATSLTSVACTDNKFIVLDLNGLPSGTTLEATSNATLTCIVVADVAAANANTNWTKDVSASYATDCSAAYYVSIPDPVFEQYLIDQGYDNDNGTTLDGRVLLANVANVNSIYLQFSALTDLTGIKAFTNLQTLYCSFSSGLTSLDVSGITTLKTLNAQSSGLMNINVSGANALESLNVSGNQLTTLDLAGLTNLKELECGDNELATLTIASTQLTSLGCRNNNLQSLTTTGMTLLTVLDCNGNQIPSLNLAGMTSLAILDCSYNALASLDVSSLTALTFFNCRNNQIQGSLNLSGSTGLNELNCSFNQFTGLNVSGLTSLVTIETRYNALATLDVSGLTGLKELYCGNNQLTDLTFANTTLERLDCYSNSFATLDLTALPDTANMSCFQNNSLTCIEVNDVAVAENNGNWSKDQDASYALECGGVTLIPDPNFEQALIDLGLDTAIDGKVLTANIMSEGGLDVSGYGITDMTGLQDFTGLVVLECQNNALTTLPLAGLENLIFLKLDNNEVSSLDLSLTPNLEQLYCRNNQITVLDFTAVQNLEGVDCSGNQIATLDFSGQTGLVQINTSNNPLTSLNLEGATGLLVVQSNNTQLTTLDVSDATVLDFLEIYGNQLTSLDLTALVNLVYLDCGENQISNLDVTMLPLLVEYYCYDNLLTSIDVTGLANLRAIACYGNQITSLDESTLANIEYLDCGDNLLTEIDLSGITNLEILVCSENQLSSLDLTGLANLYYMDCRSNPALMCIKVDDIAAAQANSQWRKSNLASYGLDCSCTATTTWDGAAWSPFAPQPDQKAIITGTYTSTGNLEVCSLEVKGTAVMNMVNGHNLTVTGTITVASTAQLIVENGANLLQDPLATANTNAGDIVFKKNSSSLYNLDYTIWSSPTSGTQTLKNFSPNTLDANFFVYNSVLNAYSNYLSLSGVFGGNPNVVTFTQGKGYLVRMPDGLPANATSVYNAAFKGIPNNGTVSIALSTGGSRFNAVGNPYPSPINIHDLINENESQLDNGTLYFWRKKNLAPTATYATITKLAYAATEGATDTGTSFTGQPDTWVINPGQGFLVKAAATATTLLFNNTMRRGINNGQFFRPGNQAATMDDSENKISRLWLDISNGAASFGQAVIGYTDETTDGLDFGWDGRLYNDADLSIYTKTEDTKLAIQARAAFTDNDVVPVSYKANNGGTFTISMSNYDGLFTTNQAVYLKDNVFNLWYNLKNGGYTFSSESGTFENRFEVVYQNSTLGTENPAFDANNVILYKQGTSINIDAGTITMKEVNIYDIRGRLIYSNANVDATKTTISNLMIEQQVLIVQITSEDNTRVSKKIIY